MSKTKPESILRYESMIKDQSHCYFDADEIDEVAFYYELDDRYQKALDATDFGLSLHPDRESLILKKIRYLLRLARLSEAEMLIPGISADGEDAILVLIEYALKKADYDRAVKLCDQILENDCAFETCFDVLDLMFDSDISTDYHLAYVEKASRFFPDGEVEFYRELGEYYKSEGLLEVSVRVYEHLLDMNPYSVDDWFDLAKVQAMQKHYNEAIDACDFALTIDDRNEDVISFKGYCYYDEESYYNAIETFNELIGQGSKKAIAYELIAECHTKLENHPEAVRCLELALELDGENSNVCYQLAMSYYNVGNKERTYEMLFRTISLDPEDYDAEAFLGELYLQDDRVDKALEHLLKAYKSMADSDNAELLGFLGDAYCKLKDWEKAADYYTQSIGKEPYHVKLIFKLIVLYLDQGEFELADEWIDRIEFYTANADRLPDLTEEDRSEILLMKEVTGTLKDVLRDAKDREL